MSGTRGNAKVLFDFLFTPVPGLLKWITERVLHKGKAKALRWMFPLVLLAFTGEFGRLSRSELLYENVLNLNASRSRLTRL